MGRSFSRCHHGGRGVGLHLVLEAVDLDGAGRRDHVLRVHRVHHVGRREPARLQGGQIDVHLDLALPSAVGVGRLRAFHRRQLRADRVLPQVVQLLLVQSLAGEAELQHRHAGRVVLDDERGKGSRRQRAHQHLVDRRHLRHRARYIYVGLKENLDDGNPVVGLRLDVLYVVHRRGHAALAVRHDALGHLVGRKSGVIPNHGHDGNIDIGENVRRHRFDREDADDQNQQRKDDKSVWPPKRKPDNPHHKGGSCSRIGLTWTPSLVSGSSTCVAGCGALARRFAPRPFQIQMNLQW